MTDCFCYMKKYINYKKLDSICSDISSSFISRTIISDPYGAFFTTLCERVVNEKFYKDISVTVFDPEFTEPVICQLFIPDRNTIILNKSAFSAKPFMCKVNKLYTIKNIRNIHQNYLIAADFLKKSYKI